MKKILLIIAITLLIFQMIVLATAIDIGSDLSNTGYNYSGPVTVITLANPANASGTITSVTIYSVISDMTNVEVATFHLISGNNYSTRDHEYIGTVTGKQQFDVNLDVEAGDYIGVYFFGGRLINNNSGNARYLANDHIPCSDTTFSTLTKTFSIYGTGETAPPAEDNVIFFGTDF